MKNVKTLFTPTGEAWGAWRELKKNWFIGMVPKFVVLLFILSLGAIAIRWTSLPPLVPLWFSRPWGAPELASPYFLLLLPFTSMLIYGINFVISIYYTSEYLVFSQMLFLSSLIVSFLSFFALVKILFLVT